MKKFLFMLGLAISLSGLYTSCKPDTLTELHDLEVADRDKYIKDHGLSGFKDPSGIYFKDSIKGTGDTIKSGYLVKVYLKVSLLNGTVLEKFTTEDDYGRNYETLDYFVDVSNTIVNSNPWQLISGLHLGLKKMQIGGVALMVIPSELAFQAVDKTSLGIPRFSTLLVKVEAVKGFSPEEQKEQQEQ